MPVGDPKPQTVASKKYQEKVGYTSKSYKLKKDIVDKFADACKKANISQAKKLSELMQNFINDMNK